MKLKFIIQNIIISSLIALFLGGVASIVDSFGIVEDLFNTPKSIDLGDNVLGAIVDDEDYDFILDNKTISNTSFDIHTKDFRAFVFDYYLSSQDSPLAGLGDVIVDNCIKHDAPEDCTVLIGIARYETDLCKYPPSQVQQNCWGFGGAGTNRYYFIDYEQGIDLVTKRLSEGYGYYNMTDPNNMEMTYCGPRESCRIWGENVQRTMDDLENLSLELGFGSLYELRTRIR